MRLLAVNNKSNKTNSEKRILHLSYIRLQNQHSILMYWLKICKAWVRSQLRWAWNWLKLNVTSSNVLRIIMHWLSARRDVGLTQGRLIPKKHSLYRALKHSIRQHKLVNTELENRPSSHLSKHSIPARRKDLSSSKQLAWNLYTIWHKVLEILNRRKVVAFRHILWFQYGSWQKK